jgi:hypothetical protein
MDFQPTTLFQPLSHSLFALSHALTPARATHTLCTEISSSSLRFWHRPEEEEEARKRFFIQKIFLSLLCFVFQCDVCVGWLVGVVAYECELLFFSLLLMLAFGCAVKCQ